MHALKNPLINLLFVSSQGQRHRMLNLESQNSKSNRKKRLKTFLDIFFFFLFLARIPSLNLILIAWGNYIYRKNYLEKPKEIKKKKGFKENFLIKKSRIYQKIKLGKNYIYIQYAPTMNGLVSKKSDLGSSYYSTS